MTIRSRPATGKLPPVPPRTTGTVPPQLIKEIAEAAHPYLCLPPDRRRKGPPEEVVTRVATTVKRWLAARRMSVDDAALRNAVGDRLTAVGRRSERPVGGAEIHLEAGKALAEMFKNIPGGSGTPGTPGTPPGPYDRDGGAPAM